MRSLFRNVFLAVVAVLALGGVATASASAALPELVNSKGAELVKKQFKGESSQRMIFEAQVGGDQECEKLLLAGGVKGTKGGEATLTLNCAGSCHTKGAKENEMKLPVSVNLVWLSKAKETVALLLSLPGVVDLEGYCWGRDAFPPHLFELSGSFLVPINVINKLSTAYTLSVKQKKGIQEPDEYENEAGEKVKAQLRATNEAFKNQPIAFANEFPLKFEEEAEFKA
jgi:hypothetical protein